MPSPACRRGSSSRLRQGHFVGTFHWLVGWCAELTSIGDYGRTRVIDDQSRTIELHRLFELSRVNVAIVAVELSLVLERLESWVFDDCRAVIGWRADHMVPEVHFVEELDDLSVHARLLEIQVDEAGVLTMKLEGLCERGDSAIVAEPAGVTESCAAKLRPGDFAHIAVELDEAVEHVVVKADEHAVLGHADVDFVAVGAKIESRAVGFDRVLMRELDARRGDK